MATLQCGTATHTFNATTVSIRLGAKSCRGPLFDPAPLTALAEVSLNNNDLTGTVPDFSPCAQLAGLYLNSNRFTGTVPDFSSNLLLQRLYLSANQLTGTVPDMSANQALEEFSLATNQLDGTIPDFSANTALRKLALSTNQFTGTIPDLSSNTALTDLYLVANLLDGTVPDFTANTALFNFQLRENQLTGSLPDMRLMTSLGDVRMNDNLFTGTVPSLPLHTSLRRLHLFNNRLHGTIPDFSANAALTDLRLSNNQWVCPVTDFSAVATNDHATTTCDSSATQPGTVPSTVPASQLASIPPTQPVTLVGTDLASLRLTDRATLPSTTTPTLLPTPSSTAVAVLTQPPSDPHTASHTQLTCIDVVSSLAVSPHAIMQQFAPARLEYDVHLPHGFVSPSAVTLHTSLSCDAPLLDGVAMQSVNESSWTSSVSTPSGKGLWKATVALATTTYLLWFLVAAPDDNSYSAVDVGLSFSNVPVQQHPQGLSDSVWVAALKREIANLTSSSTGHTYPQQLAVTHVDVDGAPCGLHSCRSSAANSTEANLDVGVRVIDSDQPDANSPADISQRLMYAVRTTVQQQDTLLSLVLPSVSVTYSNQEQPFTPGPSHTTAADDSLLWLAGVAGGVLFVAVAGVVAVKMRSRSREKKLELACEVQM